MMRASALACVRIIIYNVEKWKTTFANLLPATWV